MLNNAVFSAVLGDLHQALVAHRAKPPHEEAPHVQAHAIETEEKVSKARRQRAEASLIARLLKKMLEERLLVYDRSSNTLRPVEPGDMAVLSRVWEPLDVYEETLAAAGIPAVHAGGGNLLETREAKDGLALLRFLAEPADELALVATLRSPFFAVDDRTLHELAQERERSSSWWELVRGTSDNGLSHPRKVLEELLRARRFEPPGALLRIADRLTGYTAVIANLPGAPRREADWRGFCDLVDALGYGTEDIFSVVRSLRRMLDAEAAAPRPPLEAEEAVSLLTIHSAKGLEWPVVVIPDLSRQFPSSSSPVLFDAELGVAVVFGDGEDGEGVLYRLLKNREEKEREAEARRVFYVAPTRARDHLILTSTEWETERLCGLTLLQPGLEAARIECEFVPFLPEDARPPELPSPPPTAPPGLLVQPIASLGGLSRRF
jgi:ATP-dependent helicase/nuclease subunit A